MDWSVIRNDIEASTGEDFPVANSRPVSGGDISDAHVLESKSRKYFVKINRAHRVDMFEAEFEGLKEIQHSNSIKVPNPICYNSSSNYSYLVLEFIQFAHQNNRQCQQMLGEQIAAMHQCTAQRFGWYRDNTIGATKQINEQSDEWVAFYGARRLGVQLSLALEKGASHKLAKTVDRLHDNLESFFKTYSPVPSLLHGDLWSGNYAISELGEPVIFDPATYFGDREADIAMTELFGGYDGAFYEAYNSVFPLDDGYSVRKKLYNLYHIMNHFNLFGGGYERQAIATAESLLAEI